MSQFGQIVLIFFFCLGVPYRKQSFSDGNFQCHGQVGCPNYTLCGTGKRRIDRNFLQFFLEDHLREWKW